VLIKAHELLEVLGGKLGAAALPVSAAVAGAAVRVQDPSCLLS
jgi:hypothetical protein